ncbi:DUF6261 family protein [Segatella oulorum]|uniref:DUF6261 family protein n=1 Tax=Segatella oulorum TaxID=28136 RepID=UPI0028E381B4|nr:DUF6261 family protein [Segatella oulorum]
MKNNNNLPRYVRVNAGVKAYSSAMHGELHQQLYNLIAAQDRQKLHLTDEQLKAWNDLIMQEVELNNAQQDTELTAKMQQLDDDRDALLSQLFSAIRNNRRSPVKTLREPAERLVKLVDSYKGIQREVLQAESLHVNGLLMDLAKQSADTAALGLTAVIAMLKTTNEEFEQLELKRIDGIDKSGPTSTSALRPLTDEAFYEVRGNVEAAFYYATTAADKQMIAGLVDNMNAVLARYATSRKASEVQKAIARAMELENNHKLIDPLLPAFAMAAGYAAGDVTFTGRTLSRNSELRYELRVASTGKMLWVRVTNGRLVAIKTKPTAGGSSSATVKPKGGNHGSDGKKPSGDGKNGGDGKPDGGKQPGGGQGSATVTPKS